MPADLLEALATAQRATLYVLDAVPEAALGDRVAPRQRTVGVLFAHIANNKRLWIAEAEPDLLEGIAKLTPEHALDHARLRSGLEAANAAAETFVARASERGRLRGFTRSPATFAGYLIAHEGYHLGEIGLALTVGGHPLPQAISYGMWEWGVR